jgi:hypothetical protein
MKSCAGRVEKTHVNQDAAFKQTQSSRIRSVTIFAVLVMSSISGAAVAHLAGSDSVPDSIGQPDTWLLETPTIDSPDSMAFQSQ